jgi:hypothetical protein
LTWIRKAAEQGHKLAQSRLSIINHLGYLPEDQRDIVEAYKWQRVLADEEPFRWENIEPRKSSSVTLRMTELRSFHPSARSRMLTS